MVSEQKGEKFKDENMKWIIIPIALLFIVILRTKIRGYFWKDRNGEKLNFKDFRKRFIKGVEGATPLQQTRITLISFLPIFAGMIWGIVMTIMGKVYWMSLILAGSIPITLVQFISSWQRYKIHKKVEETINETRKKI